MVTETVLRPWSLSLPDLDDGNYEVHVMCCVNRRVLLCGHRAFADDLVEVDHEVEVTCPVCADLDSTGFCPVLPSCHRFRED